MTLDAGQTMLQKAYCMGTHYFVMNASGNGPIRGVNAIMYQNTGTTLTTTGISVSAPANRATINELISFNDLNHNLPTMTDYFFHLNSSVSSASAPSLFGYNVFASGSFTNKANVTGALLTIRATSDLGQKSHGDTSYVTAAGQDNLLSNPYLYTGQVSFVPEPCTPDTQGPVSLPSTDLVNGFTNTNYTLPGAVTAETTANNRISIRSGFMVAMMEPVSSVATTNYQYTGPAAGSGALDSSKLALYTATGSLTNQWGIDTGSAWISLTYSGVSQTATADDHGNTLTTPRDQTSLTVTNITRVFSGSELVFTPINDNNGRQKSWNNNNLAYKIEINSGVLANLQGFKKETQVIMHGVVKDLSNSLINVVTNDGRSNIRTGNNNIQSSSYNGVQNGYTFLNTGTPPVATLYKNTTLTNSASNGALTAAGRVGYAVDSTRTGVAFGFNDDRAGVNPNSFQVTINVYQSSNSLIDTYNNTTNTFKSIRAAVNPGNTGLTINGNDARLHLTAVNDLNADGIVPDYNDYKGYLDFAALGLSNYLTTGSRVVISVNTNDYVGKAAPTMTATFDMPNWPARPYAPTTLQTIDAGAAITPINLRTLMQQSNDPNYAALSGFTLANNTGSSTNGAISIPNIGGASLSGITLNTDGTISGIANASGVSANTNFVFNVYARNKFGQSSTIQVTLKIVPGCGTAGGNCGSRLYIYTGSTVTEAESGYNHGGSGTWFGVNWFARINGATNPVLTGSSIPGAITLLCGVGTPIYNLPINAAGPFPTSTSATLTKTGLSISTTNQLYITGNTIYVVRPMSATINWSVPALKDDGSTNRTNTPYMTGTVIVTGGWISGTNLYAQADYRAAYNNAANYSWNGHTVGKQNNEQRDTASTNSISNSTITGLVALGGGVRAYGIGIDAADMNSALSGQTLTITNITGATTGLNVNPRWYDVFAPVATTSVQGLSNGAQKVTLSGTNQGNSNYLDDDMFRIVSFSGATLPNITTIVDTNANYEDISNYNTNNGTVSSTHYGLNRQIVFANSRNGSITYMDKAGNTNTVAINVVVPDVVKTINVKYIPEFRPLNSYNDTGVLYRYYTPGTTNFVTDTNSVDRPVAVAIGDTNNRSAGSGNVTIAAQAQAQSNVKYMFILSLQGYLPSAIIGNGDISNVTGLDYTNSGGVRPVGSIYTGTNYLVAGDVVKGSGTVIGIGAGLLAPSAQEFQVPDTESVINSLDLAAVNHAIGFGAFDRSLDLDANGAISSVEQAIIIQNLDKKGAAAVCSNGSYPPYCGN